MEFEIAILMAGIAGATLVVAKSVRSVSPYAFLMAKIRAWEARAVPDAKLESLLESGSLQQLLVGLRGTDYETDLERVPESIEELEAALSRHLFRTYGELLKLVPERASGFVKKFGERLDLGHLKLVVQAVSGAMPREVAIAHLGEGMVFSKSRLEVMARCDTIHALIQQLSETDYYDQLKRYLEPGEYDPSELMRAIDQSYYASLWSRCEDLGRKNGRIARMILGREIDYVNLKLILRLKAAGVAADIIMKNLVAVGGQLGFDILRSCVEADSLEEARNVLSKSSLKATLAPLFSAAGDDIGELEKLLDQSLLDYCKTAALFQPLTIATPLAFLYQKHAEVRNIRSVARGVADRVPAGEIRAILLRSARIE